MKKLLLATLLFSAISNAEMISDSQLHQMWKAPQTAAEKLVADMSLEEKIGQMVMMDFRSWQADGQEQKQPVIELNSMIAEIIAKYHLGSVILFRENLIDTPQTVKLINDLQDARSNLPLMISTDQEGGYVTRLRVGTEMPGNMALGATRSQKLTELAGDIHGQELAALGFNFNFGPVVDVNNNQNNPVIGVRSYSDSPEWVSDLAKSYIRGIHPHGIMTSLKHFPGHGNVVSDTHFALPVIAIDKAAWQTTELPPFVNAMPYTDAIMTAHVVLPALDNATLINKKGETMGTPATLSHPILTDTLRNQLGFKGLIVTDAMEMGAISSNFDTEWAVTEAIKAGNDIILMPVAISNPQEVTKLDSLYSTIKQQAEKDPQLMQRINESATRIVKTKLEKQISADHKSPQTAETIVASAEHRAIENDISAKAITVIENDGVLPWKLQTNNKIFIYSDEQPRNELITKHLSSIAEETNVDMTLDSRVAKLGLDDLDKQTIDNDIDGSDLIILATYNLKENPANAQRVIDRAKIKNIPVVVISTRNPYDIAYLHDVKANIAIYGITGFDVTNNVRNSLETNISSGLRTLFVSGQPGAKPLNNPVGKLPVNIKSPDGSTILYSRSHGLTW